MKESLKQLDLSLKDRILQISQQEKLSHIGSCISAVDAIDAIYSIKQPEDTFILSNGHSALAWYVVLEKYYGTDATKLMHESGVHPTAKTHPEIKVSTGSLGNGLPITVGMSLARPDEQFYCMVSDGEMAEGSIWEALRVGQEQNTTNLKVICNMNGWAAYRETDPEKLIKQVAGFGWQVDCVDGHNKEELIQSLTIKSPEPHFIFAYTNSDTDFSKGLESHYKTIQ